MNSADNFLLVTHAWLETAWTPVRRLFQEPKLAALMFAARCEKLRLPTFANDGRAWKRDQRERDLLVAKGLMSKGSMTAKGKRLVRSWCWPTTRSDLFEAVDRILECVDRRWCRKGNWTPETFVAGCEWGDATDPLIDLQSLFIPPLIDGWLQAHCTSDGHCFYRIVEGTDIAAAIDSTSPNERDFRTAYLDKYLMHVVQLRKMLLAGSLNINAGN